MPDQSKVTLGRKSVKSGVYRKSQKWETAEELSQIHSLHSQSKPRKFSSLTFQAEIADRGGHERGEETPGGEMLHQKPHNQLSRSRVALDRARKVEATE